MRISDWSSDVCSSDLKLAEALGLTFQQVQKYERGANRIGAGRLYELSRALDVPVSYFFEEISDGAGGMREEPAAYGEDPMASRQTTLLVRAYYGIGAPSVRRRIMAFMKWPGVEPPGHGDRNR